jgi:RimJ/RimL family protein N-acetyltransferase
VAPDAARPEPIRTERLTLVPVDVKLARAELADPALFESLVGGTVPDSWPPEMLADARDLFLGLLEDNPDWVGWLGWYALWHWKPGEPPQLVGSGGFLGPADETGRIELGYSIVPECYGMGIATEMTRALVDWAESHETVRAIVAQTSVDNSASRNVLRKLGFEDIGEGDEPSSHLFRRTSARNVDVPSRS